MTGFHFAPSFDASPQNLYSLTASIYQLYSVNHELMQENALLKCSAKRAHDEKTAVLLENADLKRKANCNGEVAKRKYSQRRSWL